MNADHPLPLDFKSVEKLVYKLKGDERWQCEGETEASSQNHI